MCPSIFYKASVPEVAAKGFLMSEKIMTCAIMQPTFLPWAGYFNLINDSDYFVFLTDAEYQKGSWHSRNQILVQGNQSWITCPIQRDGLHTSLDKIKLQADERWRLKLIRTMQQSYKKAPFFADLEFILDVIMDLKDLSLVELNIRLIKLISAGMGLETQFSKSRDLNIELDRSNKLVEIIKVMNCGRYLSPVGAKDYLYDDNVLPNSGVVLDFQDYVPTEYKQFNAKTFVSHLSIFDVIGNLGLKEARDYVQSAK